MIESAQRVRNIISNLSWQAGAKVINLAMSVLAGGLVARHLHHDLSEYRTAQFYVSLVTPLTVIISNNVIMRRLVARESEGLILGTAMWMIALSGLLFFSVVAAGSLLWSENRSQQLLFIVAALSLLVWWPIPFGHALEAHLHGRESALSASLGSLAMRSWEILCAVQGLSIIWLCGSVPIGTAITMVFLAIFYFRLRQEHLAHWRWDSTTAWQLLKESSPLILGGLASGALFRINIVLLREWAGNAEASYYSAALELPLSMQMIAGVLLTVFFPGLTHLLTHEPLRAWNRLDQFTRLGAALGLLSALGLCLGAPLWTNWIYGPDFKPTAQVLAVTAWILPAMFMAQARGAWLLHTQRTSIELYYILGGVLLDVVLAWLWVPSMGAVGAAWALVAAYAFTWVISSLIHTHTRRIGILQLRASIWPFPTWQEFNLKR
jgi:O-antigen/teichoic acid export membrane protein